MNAGASGGPELPWRHPIAVPELLAEVVLGIEAAASGDLGDAQVAVLEQSGSLLQTLLLEKMAEKAPGHPVEAARDVLARVPQFSGYSLHSDFFVRA